MVSVLAISVTFGTTSPQKGEAMAARLRKKKKRNSQKSAK